MYGVALLLTVAAVGINTQTDGVVYGWQPGDDGQLEYIIQIEPELVKILSERDVDLLSEIPEELQGVRRLRIRVGTGEVPRKGLDPAATARAMRPGDSPANQQPTLNGGQGQFQVGGARSSTDTSGSASQPGRILTPPGRTTGDATSPVGSDRFSGAAGNSSFPSSGTAAGAGRNPSSAIGQAGASDAATQTPNSRQPIDYDSLQNPSATTRPASVWDSKTNQWRTPTAPTGSNLNTQPPNTVNDPRNGSAPDPRDQRYDDRTADTTGGQPSTGLPEIRRDNVTNPQDPRYNAPPAGYGPNQYNPNLPNQWAQQPNYVQPLQDPDRGYYGVYGQQAPPPYYNPNLPLNRQVGYQVAAAPTPPPAAVGASNPAPAAGAATATETATSKVSTASSARERQEAREPWLPLTLMAMAFFASLGLNIYLGWIAHGVYQRYRALLMEVRNVRAAAV